MATAGDFLVPALQASGISRRSLAAATGSSAAGLTEVFHGLKDTTVGRLDRLLQHLDHTLVAVPTKFASVALIAQVVGRDLKNGQPQNAFRAVLQGIEDLRAADPATRVALSITPPPSTGSPAHDALIAGICEWALSWDDLPLPRWLQEAVPLDPPWDVEPVANLRAQGRRDTPAAIARHGVFIEAQSLFNV